MPEEMFLGRISTQILELKAELFAKYFYCVYGVHGNGCLCQNCFVLFKYWNSYEHD